MSGKIVSGQQCTVESIEPKLLKRSCDELCKVDNKEYLQLVKANQGKKNPDW
jgi:hypothetical protein